MYFRVVNLCPCTSFRTEEKDNILFARHCCPHLTKSKQQQSSRRNDETVNRVRVQLLVSILNLSNQNVNKPFTKPKSMSWINLCPDYDHLLISVVLCSAGWYSYTKLYVCLLSSKHFRNSTLPLARLAFSAKRSANNVSVT